VLARALKARFEKLRKIGDRAVCTVTGKSENKTKEELQMNREKRITKTTENAVTLAALHTHTHS